MYEYLCSHGEMDITTVFGTVIVGSSPTGGTKLYLARLFECGQGESDSRLILGKDLFYH